MANTNDLNGKINELNDQLNQTQPKNEQTQAVVEDLRTQIQPIVDNPNEDHSHRYESLSERLDHSVLHLEVEHPELSLAIKNVLAELASVGI